jgi:hypothetical protein
MVQFSICCCNILISAGQNIVSNRLVIFHLSHLDILSTCSINLLIFFRFLANAFCISRLFQIFIPTLLLKNKELNNSLSHHQVSLETVFPNFLANCSISHLSTNFFVKLLTLSTISSAKSLALYKALSSQSINFVDSSGIFPRAKSFKAVLVFSNATHISLNF